MCLSLGMNVLSSVIDTQLALSINDVPCLCISRVD